MSYKQSSKHLGLSIGRNRKGGELSQQSRLPRGTEDNLHILPASVLMSLRIGDAQLIVDLIVLQHELRSHRPLQIYSPSRFVPVLSMSELSGGP